MRLTPAVIAKLATFVIDRLERLVIGGFDICNPAVDNPTLIPEYFSLLPFGVDILGYCQSHNVDKTFLTTHNVDLDTYERTAPNRCLDHHSLAFVKSRPKTSWRWYRDCHFGAV